MRNFHRELVVTWLRRLAGLFLVLLITGYAAFWGGFTAYSSEGSWTKVSNNLFESSYTSSTRLPEFFGLLSQVPVITKIIGIAVLAVVFRYLFMLIPPAIKAWSKVPLPGGRLKLLLGVVAAVLRTGMSIARNSYRPLLVFLAGGAVLFVLQNPTQWGQQASTISTNVSRVALADHPKGEDASLRALQRSYSKSFGNQAVTDGMPKADAVSAAVVRSIPDATALGIHLWLQATVLLLPAVLLLAVCFRQLSQYGWYLLTAGVALVAAKFAVTLISLRLMGGLVALETFMRSASGITLVLAGLLAAGITGFALLKGNRLRRRRKSLAGLPERLASPIPEEATA